MMDPNSSVRKAIIIESRKWLKTPFVHQAEIIGSGCDCAHFVNAVFSKLHLIPRLTFPQYGPDWWRHTDDPEKHIIENVKKYFTEISESEAKEGDLVVLYIGKAWGHCAILSGKNSAVEAWPPRAAVAEVNTKTDRLYSSHAKRFFTIFKGASK